MRGFVPACADHGVTVKNKVRCNHSYGYAQPSVELRSALFSCIRRQHGIAPDQLRQRVAVELGEQVGAVGFDGARRQRQHARDLLVGEPLHDEGQHLALALRQLRHPLARGVVGLRALARAHMLAHGLLQGFEQLLIVHRLLQELGRAGLEGAAAHLDRAVAGQHDHGLVDALRHQPVEHREAADAGHAHVQHDGADARAVEAVDEGLRIGPALHAQADGADQQRQAVAHGLVVVDQVDQGRLRLVGGGWRGHVEGATSGSSKVKRAPRGEALAALRLPPMPLASVSLRLRPRPRPPSRVLKKGSNRRGSASGAMPRPLSVTVSTPSSPLRPTETTRRRSAAGTRSSACIAFMSRLCTICSSATASACTRTGACALASNWAATPWRANSGASRCMALRTTSCSTSGFTSPPASGRSITRRSRPTTPDARRACSTACPIASRAVARSGGSSSSRRRAAWALASTAVSGWLSSCASPADSSPSALSRATWPSRRSSSARRRAMRWRCAAHRPASSSTIATAQPPMVRHGSSAQPTWRSATSSKGWLGDASSLLRL
eukprot:Opistho-1_new@31105